MKKHKKKYVILLTFILILASNLGFVQAFEFQDVDDHWAREQIDDWVERGIAKGYPDNTFKPDNYITRAEFISLINRVCGFSDFVDVSYSDMKATDWFYLEIGKAVKRGYISGYEDNTIRPRNYITRQEVAIIITKILELDISTKASGRGGIIDAGDIPLWSSDEINAVMSNGFMTGYPDNSFRPMKEVTRAEAIVALDRIIDELDKAVNLNKSGEYALGIVNKGVVVESSNVVIKDAVIRGDLIVSQFVEDGFITLDNVIVEGKVFINSGGDNEIQLIDTQLNEVIIDKADGKASLFAKGNTNIAYTIIKSKTLLEENEEIKGNGFVEVYIEESTPRNTRIGLSGHFDKVTIAARRVRVSLLDGVVEEMEITSDGKDSVVVLTSGTRVNLLIIDAESDIIGKGRIKKVVINVNGVRIQQQPSEVDLAKGVKAEIGYGAKEEEEEDDKEIPNPSTIASLSDLKIDGVTIDGFHPGKNQYFILLPKGTSTVPKVTATTADRRASLKITEANSLPGITVVKVKAEDKVNFTEYWVNFAVAEDEPGENSPPVRNNIPKGILKVGEEVVLKPSYLAINGDWVEEATSDNSSVVEVDVLNQEGILLSAIDIGEVTITAKVYNDFGHDKVSFDIKVIKDDGGIDKDKILDIVKDNLNLTVQDAKGKDKTPKIMLPETDNYGYETEITWESENEEYIVIEENAAIIYRRGSSGNDGGCGDHEDSGANTIGIQESYIDNGGITIFCDDGGDEGGCSGSGGNITIVKLIATINKDSETVTKDFNVNIPWGWGKDVTIGNKEDKDSCEEETALPVPNNFNEQILRINGYPLILMAEDLAYGGKKIIDASDEASNVIELEVFKDGRLKVTPINIGETEIMTVVHNKAGEVDCKFKVIVEYAEEVTDDVAVQEAYDSLNLSVYTRGEGPKQTSKVALPNTDMLGYETEITWEADDEEFITISGEEAMIHRRGNKSEGGSDDGGCGEHSITLIALGEISINCSDDGGDCGGEDSGQSGKANTVKLRATITKGSVKEVKEFSVIIPWGWGREIIIDEL